MARYIDIEGAGIGKANREQFLVPEFADGWNAVLKILDKEPTADVAEVVRCPDCIYCENMKCTELKDNTGHPLDVAIFDYCSQGVRKGRRDA